MHRRVGLVVASVHSDAVEPAHEVHARAKVCAEDPHHCRARLRATLGVEGRDDRGRVVHEPHPARRELLPVGRHLHHHRPRRVLRARHQEHVVDAVLVVRLDAGPRADAEAPGRERRPGAQGQLLHQPLAIQLHAQPRRAVRQQHAHKAPSPHEGGWQRAPEQQHVAQVHLQLLGARAQQHPQPTACALLAKRHLRQHAEANARALAAVAAAGVQAEARLKVPLLLPQRR